MICTWSSAVASEKLRATCCVNDFWRGVVLHCEGLRGSGLGERSRHSGTASATAWNHDGITAEDSTTCPLPEDPPGQLWNPHISISHSCNLESNREAFDI